MALNINLTLVIQIINFLIAYVLINSLFLKPGYRALKADEDRLRQLRGALVHEQEILAQKEHYKKDRWRSCQNYFSANRPVAQEIAGGMKSTDAIVPLPDISQQQIAASAQEISKKLESRLLND
jgi:hypothetical protein